jgi:hypothetical protein
VRKVTSAKILEIESVVVTPPEITAAIEAVAETTVVVIATDKTVVIVRGEIKKAPTRANHLDDLMVSHETDSKAMAQWLASRAVIDVAARVEMNRAMTPAVSLLRVAHAAHIVTVAMAVRAETQGAQGTVASLVSVGREMSVMAKTVLTPQTMALSV